VSAAKIVNYHLGRKRFIKKRIPSHFESIHGKFVALLYSQYKIITHKMGETILLFDLNLDLLLFVLFIAAGK
jgi:hypothetical protein